MIGVSDGGMGEDIRIALVLGLVLIVVTSIEHASSVGPPTIVFLCGSMCVTNLQQHRIVIGILVIPMKA